MDEELDEWGTTPAPTLAEANVELQEVAASQPLTVEQVIARLEGEGVSVERMHVKEGELVELTKRELLRICAENPSHPHVEVYKRAVSGLLANEKIAVDRIDLDAIIQNKQVEIVPEQRQVGDKIFVVENKRFVGESG